MSLAEETYRAIKRDIIRCELKPGERIVQGELAERYETSTTPIRDALHRLARQKLVRPIARFGYVVTPVTVEDVRELYEMRQVLEIAACRWAANRGSEERLAELRKDADFVYVYGDKASYSEFLAQNVDFHRAIACAASNHRLVDQLTDVLEELQRIFHLGLSLSRRDNAAVMRQGHLDLAEALWDRDADQAEELIRAELSLSEDTVLDGLMRGGLPSSDWGESVRLSS
jgi:DNA-binding GntR family transcriptional regulator